MNNKRYLGIVIMVLALLLTLSVGLSASRDVQDDLQPAPPASVSAGVDHKIPVQGRLTNASGSPLNGDYNLTLSLYDVQKGGNPQCADTHLVSVEKGLFNTSIACPPWVVNGSQLYMGVKVGNDGEMKPRQPIYPVPYAYSLVHGARINDFKSNAKSYLFVPGAQFRKKHYANPTKFSLYGSTASIASGASGPFFREIEIPITIPAVLYGTPVRVTEIKVYYQCPNVNNYIGQTFLEKNTETGSSNIINLLSDIDRDKDHKNTSANASYTYNTQSPANLLSADQGFLTLKLNLQFSDDNEWINIGGVRLTLEHK